MKTPYAGLLAGLLLATITTMAIATELPARNEYAYGFDLAIQGGSGFFSVPVPLDVYRSVTDPGLRDAGVYNADGQPVPRLFEQPPGNENSIEQEITLALVPLYGQMAEQEEQIRLLLHQDATGTRIELNAPQQGSGQAHNENSTVEDEKKILTAYIVDVRNLKQTLNVLTFNWQQQARGFIGRVRLETGNDLQRWRELGSATLAELVYEDTRIEHKTLKLSTQLSDYLRITWSDMPAEWGLQSVTGTFVHTTKSVPPAHEWIALDPVQTIETSNEYLFDVGGYPPTDRINLLLPDENIVLRASVFHRRSETDNWRLSHNGIFYNITRQGKTLQSVATIVPEARSSQWKVRIESGSTSGPVQLQLGWQPDQLVFLAQGTPPYELVAGRAHDRLEQFPQERVLGDNSIFDMLRRSGTAGIASLGPRRVIAGTDQLTVASTNRWRVLLLWAGLLAAIGLVGWLVFSLMREMKKAD